MIKEYMRSYSSNNKIISLLVLLSILLITLIPTKTNAVGVGVNYTGSWRKSQYFDCSRSAGCDFDARTDFTMSLSKNFDLNVARIGNLIQNEWRVIRPGESISGINYGVTGSYSYSYGDKRTPPLDGNIYPWYYTSNKGFYGISFEVRNQMRGGISSQLGYTLSSSDNSVIDCSSTGGSYCVARDKDGTATITVSFPGSGSYYLQRNFEWGENVTTYNRIAPTTKTGPRRCKDCTPATTYLCPSGYTLKSSGGSDRGIGIRTYCESNTPTVTWNKQGDGEWNGAWNYTLNPISYNVRVERPNQPPVVSNVNTNNINYNTSTVNWAFTDPDNGDYQTDVEVKVYASSDNNLVFIGSTTGNNVRSLNINRLRPGTRYYPQVRAKDSKGAWSSWVNGSQFTTLVNNPPNLSELSCGVTSGSTDYEKARLTWNYKGTDEAGDELILKSRWKRSDESNWELVNLRSTRTGEIDILNLISGYVYELQVSLNDSRNTHLGDRWQGCGIVTPPNYPEPTVEFRLSKSGDNTQIRNGETLTVKTKDSVNANWNITDAVGLESCKVDTTGGDGIKLFESSSFNGSVNKTMPINTNDLTYIVSLSCTGRAAKVPRTVNQSITLVVESWPTVSCSIQGDNTVREGDISVNINTRVDNATSYTWEAGPDDSRKGTNKKTGNSPIPNPLTLEYTGLDFGRYKPWVRVETSEGKTSTGECGTITNFGKSTIREVNP